MKKHDMTHPDPGVSRRLLLQFGACLVLTTAACEKTKSALARVADDEANAGIDGSDGPQNGLGPRPNPGPPSAGVFAGIETVVVLMMENRSFDHFFGMLRSDSTYPGSQTVECYHGNEENPWANGKTVRPAPLTTHVQGDPQHSWNAAHSQWNNGLNDGFAKASPGLEQEVMGYFKRSDLPFTYWLADNFTLCDHWFASVMGPTWPNRAVLHATTASGIRSNYPVANPPQTIWDALPLAGKDGKNYYAGATSTYAGLYAAKVKAGVNPTAPLDDFFTAAQAGTLPAFVLVDPDWETNDDHPPHDIHLGQALISSVYQALANSPQWSKCLFILTYDEHGGFFDHVPPPTCVDADPAYTQLGFRLPAIVCGPTVRRGAVCSTVFEHSSVAATLKTCFGMANLTPRMASTNDLSSCIDPDAVNAPRPPPPNAPVIAVTADLLLADNAPKGHSELIKMANAGQISAQATDSRTRSDRLSSWLETAHRLGAIKYKKAPGET